MRGGICRLPRSDCHHGLRHVGRGGAQGCALLVMHRGGPHLQTPQHGALGLSNLTLVTSPFSFRKAARPVTPRSCPLAEGKEGPARDGDRKTKVPPSPGKASF